MINFIIIIYYFFFAYLMAGLSTTNIMRLLKGAKHRVADVDCYCLECGYKIPLKDQLPIISHIVSKGKCRNCNTEIPIVQFCLEVVIFIVFILIYAINKFQDNAIFYSFIFYEGIKVLVLMVKGHRENGFLKQLIGSASVNIIMHLSMFIIVKVFKMIFILFIM